MIQWLRFIAFHCTREDRVRVRVRVRVSVNII